MPDLSAWIFTRTDLGRGGGERPLWRLEYHGEIATDPAAIRKLCDRLGRSGNPLAFCYEAGVDLHFNVVFRLFHCSDLPSGHNGAIRQPT